MTPAARKPIWHDAFAMAARLHAPQVRRDGRTPYAAHTLRVALIVAHEFGCADDEIIAAAALHDVIEDTPADYDDIADAFGTRVADLVAVLSKDHRVAGGPRDAAYHRAVAGADDAALLIKAADIIDNTRDAGTHLNAARLARVRAAADHVLAAITSREATPELARAEAALRSLTNDG